MQLHNLNSTQLNSIIIIIMTQFRKHGEKIDRLEEIVFCCFELNLIIIIFDYRHISNRYDQGKFGMHLFIWKKFRYCHWPV